MVCVVCLAVSPRVADDICVRVFVCLAVSPRVADDIRQMTWHPIDPQKCGGRPLSRNLFVGALVLPPVLGLLAPIAPLDRLPWEPPSPPSRDSPRRYPPQPQVAGEEVEDCAQLGRFT